MTTPTPTVWDVLHVEDAADAVARAASASITGAINVSYGEAVELSAIARRIAARTGAVVECAVSHPSFQLDITRARETLAWVPPSLDARLSELYAAYAADE